MTVVPEKLTPLRKISQNKAFMHAILIASIGIMLSTYILYHFKQADDKRQSMEFDRLANTQMDAISDQVTLSLTSLRSTRGLFDSSTFVSRSEFKTFFESLNTGASIQALEWIPRISNEERPQFEADVRRSGFADFSISERQSHGAMVTASIRGEYFPVHFVSPAEGNEAALGFDLGSIPARLVALETSRDSGEMYATSRITLDQESRDQYGTLVFIPVYKDGQRPESIDARRQNLVGFGLGIYRIGDMINTALHEHGGAASGLEIFVLDDTADQNNRLLYPKGAELQSLASSEAAIRFAGEIEVAGRIWSVVIVPAAGSIFTQTLWQPYVIFIAALLITFMLSTYMYYAEQRSEYAENLVRKRTEELHAVNVSLQETQVQLKQLALHDPLTGAPNRKLFHEQLALALKVAKRVRKNVAVMVIDLDGFKAVNDSLGHQAGDEVLCETARRMNSSIREADFFARLGGDEFAVLMNVGASASGAAQLARKMGKAMAPPFAVGAHNIQVGISIGIAVFPDHAKDGETLTNLADIAMYKAKKGDKLFTVSDGDGSIFNAA